MCTLEFLRAAGIECCTDYGMAGVSRFEDLGAWQLANELKKRAYELCQRPLVARDFGFRNQLQDAAASGPRNIAEGFGRFRHADFARFVRIARASEQEVLNHFRDAVDRGYLTAEELPEFEHAARRALHAASGLLRYLDTHPDPPQ
ncbi:MAG: four helix bundle protein [Vicinamibacterales bacterium]|nr:four helix bundle protein [Vicinamibacterales bacterium]